MIVRDRRPRISLYGGLDFVAFLDHFQYLPYIGTSLSINGQNKTAADKTTKAWRTRQET